MESEILAGLMSIVTASAGFLGMPIDDSQQTHDHDTHSHPGDDLKLGSAHEHALFYLNVDGDEKNFTQRKHQVRSPYVHLENFKPHIVHKHSENVTWNQFLDTINVKIDKNTSCISFKDSNHCGNISVVLNNEGADLTSEIQQGDNLAVLLNSTNMSNSYMRKELPEDYTKRAPTRIA